MKAKAATSFLLTPIPPDYRSGWDRSMPIRGIVQRPRPTDNFAPRNPGRGRLMARPFPSQRARDGGSERQPHA